MASKMGVRLEDTPTGNTWPGAAKLLSISLIRSKDLEAWGQDVVPDPVRETTLGH